MRDLLMNTVRDRTCDIKSEEKEKNGKKKKMLRSKWIL